MKCETKFEKITPSSPTKTRSFYVNDEGVFYQDENETRRICSKLEVKALVYDHVYDNWGRLLVFYDKAGHLHRWAMPMEMLKSSHGDEVRGQLLRLGLDITFSTRHRHLLLEYIATREPTLHARCVTQTGWHYPVFVLSDHTFGQSAEWILYQSDNPTRAYQKLGTLTEWQTQVARWCIGNSRLVLAVSCAFAAMLLHPSGAESGGLHFVGESSTGKTTALRVAASVYGAPHYVHRWRATTNGLEALAALHSDTLLILDELAQVDPKEAGETAYMLANGSGKARAAKSGAARACSEWRLLFLSAGEIGLAQHMREAGKQSKAGQAVRLVDIPADANHGHGIFENLHPFESGALLSKNLNDATTQFYGTAAHTFLEHLTDTHNLATLADTMKTLRDQFVAENLPPHSSGQVHRVCERFGLIAAAGELATHYGITQWPAHEAERAAIRCFQAWLEQRGGIDNQERFHILAHVQAFFEAHGASRFEDLKNEQRIINRVGFKIAKPNEATEYFVLPEMFRRELCNGQDPKRVANLLAEVGMLALSAEGRTQITRRLPGYGAKRCYHFIKTTL